MVVYQVDEYTIDFGFRFFYNIIQVSVIIACDLGFHLLKRK